MKSNILSNLEYALTYENDCISQLKVRLRFDEFDIPFETLYSVVDNNEKNTTCQLLLL